MAALTVVEGDHVQSVEQLSFILVNTLDVDVKHGVRIDLDPVGGLQVTSKLLLVLLQQNKDDQLCQRS